MDILYVGVILLLGLVLGSFYNVCVYRIPIKESIIYTPSHCLSCNNPIKKYDLIPIISFTLLKGKCRSCKSNISIQYPFIELITCILFIILFLRFGISIDFAFYSLLISVLIVTAVIDYKTKYIYTFISVIGIIGGIGFVLYKYYSGEDIFIYILGAIIASLILSILALLGTMGWGDVEIAFMSGLYLGFYNSLVMLFVSIVIGGVVGIILLISNKILRKGNKPMAFGPYLAIACFISLVCGDSLIKAFMVWHGLY